MKYKIAKDFNVVIAYGDTTGLNDTDENMFIEWEKTLPANHYLVVTDNNESTWGRCDITGLDADLIEVESMRLIW
jgi:hypothetical protein